MTDFWQGMICEYRFGGLDLSHKLILFDTPRARTIAFTIALGNRPVKLFSYLIIPRAIIGELVITSNNL